MKKTLAPVTKTRIFATPALIGNSNHSFEDLLGFLLPQRKARVLSFHHRDDRLRALWGELLSRSIIREHLGEAFQNRQYGVNECGKPYLESREDFHFNVTHCGEWVFLIVSPFSCGIDCEKLKPINLKMGRRYFTPEEADYIESLPKDQQSLAFFRIWTLKESYLKMLGIGLTRGMKFFSIIPDQSIGFDGKALEQEPFIYTIQWQGNYVLSAMAAKAKKILAPIIRSQDEVLSVLSKTNGADK
ncbi:MAG: 4'-phosphopantetheinyl transferase superfamily protein [Spirochaetales bacterium]|nr:4'-phosphopantetheinyl transferase superfamily protein [Spirochaetales bacterium]